MSIKGWWDSTLIRIQLDTRSLSFSTQWRWEGGEEHQHSIWPLRIPDFFLKKKNLKLHISFWDIYSINNFLFPESQNSYGWEGPQRSSCDPRDHSRQCPNVQTASEHLQGWRHHNFSWQSPPVSAWSLRQKVFPVVHREHPVFHTACAHCSLLCH